VTSLNIKSYKGVHTNPTETKQHDGFTMHV